MGYECLTRPELEWYFINKDFEPIDNGSYLDLPPKDLYHELRRQISDDMIEKGEKLCVPFEQNLVKLIQDQSINFTLIDEKYKEIEKLNF